MDSWYNEIKSHLKPALEKKNSLVVENLPTSISNSLNCLKRIDRNLSIIKSYEKNISEILELIENLTFFPIDFYDNNIQDFSKTFDKFNARINGNAAVITGAMTYIAQYVNLIEYICFDTTTGHHKSMQLYYEKYDSALYDVFTGMVIKNYNTLRKILDGDRVAFVIRGRWVNKNFDFDPDISKIMDIGIATIDIIANQFNSVPRWLKTMNLRCPEIRQLETMETHLPYSFGVIEKLPVLESKDACLQSFQKFCRVLESQTEKFTKFKFLGEKRYDLVISRFTDTDPVLNDYKEKIEFFVVLPEKMEIFKCMDLGCFRLENTEIVDIFTEQCQLWVSIYGEILVSKTNDIATTFSERIAALEKQSNTDILDDDDGKKLMILLNVVKEIKRTNIDADIIFRDIHSRFDYLVKHNIVIPKEHILTFKNVKAKWQDLYIQALAKDLCIEDAKTIFLKKKKNN